MTARILSAVVHLIPALIIFACAGSAFAVHDWDVPGTLIGEDPLAVVERLVPVAAEVDEEPFELTELTLSEDGSNLVLDIHIHSPFTVPIILKALEIQLECAGTTITFRAPAEVVIPARGGASVRLEGALPGPTAPPALLPLDQSTLRRISITVDVSGIELQWESSELGGLG
jgi:hypothetical protein